MTQPPTSGYESKPYKGPEFYRTEDAELFFGREFEAGQLIAQILSARVTLLHAPSGAGKTSLLNARIIPGLEVRGWGAFRVLPQNNPMDSVRSTTLAYLLPSPDAELQAIERAASKLCGAGEDPTIEEMLARYDDLKPGDESRRRLIAPLATPDELTTGSRLEVGSVIPYFCRLLRSTIEIEAFAEHLHAVLRQTVPHNDQPQINRRTRLSELRDFISTPEFIKAWDELFDELNPADSDLAGFFNNLALVYGQRRSGFTLALILDQFEELFTRFIDPGRAVVKSQSDLPDWRLRYEFFAQLKQLYGKDGEPPPAAGLAIAEGSGPSVPALPIRYVISMRDEYIAKLDEIRQFVWNLDKNSYHLGLLEKDQATIAIREPASVFGYGYSDECYRRIISELTIEDRFVEPKHLQLVCDKLWKEREKKIEDAVAQGHGAHFDVIEHDVLDKLKGTAGILHSFFDEFLHILESDAERLEALDMLESLVTTSGTRNIMEREHLLNSPFRDRERRERILGQLENHTIIRTERRFRGYFVEITHEFLIGPILEAQQRHLNQDVGYNQLRWALRTLERLYEDRDLSPESRRLLMPEEFKILHQRREDVFWDVWGAELMFRSAIKTGAGKEAMAYWAGQVDHYASPESQRKG